MTDAGSDETRAEIMQATFQALRRHGYADLSIEHISGELGKSKSLLYYYYESKDEVLLALLDHAIEEYVGDLDVDAETSPETALKQFLDTLLAPPTVQAGPELIAVLLELRVQGVSDAAYRERFTRLDQRLHTTIEDLIEHGIEAGEFSPVDARQVAGHIVIMINGIILQQATTAGDSTLSNVPRDALMSYLDETLGENR